MFFNCQEKKHGCIIQEEGIDVVTYSDPSVAQEQNNQNVVLEHESDMNLAHDDPNEHNGNSKQGCNKQPINDEDMEDADVKEDADDEVDDNAELEEDDANDGYDEDEDDE
ncbi:hypothetical protein Tco_1170308 [Tanacetum coccineum]